MTKCRNCGHDSHCGNPLSQTISQTLSGIGGTKVEVCKTCRCEKCSPKTDWG